jgi:DNA-binding response OmpR family regulator
MVAANVSCAGKTAGVGNNAFRAAGCSGAGRDELRPKLGGGILEGETTYPRHEILEIDENLQIDLSCPEIWLRGKRVDLTKKTWELLCYMAQRRGQVITLEELRDNVWSGKSQNPPSLNSIKQYVMNLRRKLKDDPGRPKYVLSKRGFGYRFMEPTSPYELSDSVSNS